MSARRHLRDVATICPETLTLSTGVTLGRCELNVGHDGQHKSGCARWRNRNTEASP